MQGLLVYSPSFDKRAWTLIPISSINPAGEFGETRRGARFSLLFFVIQEKKAREPVPI
jgi:hypothetical protein